jgi:hypothetical protein
MKTTELLLLGVMVGGAIYFNRKQESRFGSGIQGKPKMPGSRDVFPIKADATNIFVENIQKAMINKGGEYAHLILSGGGVTGEYNEQTQKAVEMAGFPVEVDQTAYRQIVNNSKVMRNYAYVIDVDGAPLYSSISDNHVPDFGYGRDLLMKIPCKTYLGVATGNFKNGMIEISTTINTKRIKFWVPTEKIGLLSRAEYEAMKDSKLLSKSEEHRVKLLKA